MIVTIEKGTCNICQKVEETMEHMLECKEAKIIIGGKTGSETIKSENKEELMTIYNYMERILKNTEINNKKKISLTMSDNERRRRRRYINWLLCLSEQ